jgi:hypothetical protein
MLKKLGFLLAAVLLTSLGAGCGGDKDKGINKDKDRPKMEDKDK